MSKFKDIQFQLIIDIMNRVGGRFWMDAGTCLAIVRKGDFIAETDDIDIGIFGNHADLRGEYIKEFTDKGYDLSKERSFDGKLQTIGFTGPEKLDLFFYYGKDEFMWHAVCGWEDERKFRKVFKPEKFSCALFTNLKGVVFKDRDVYLPNPPEKCLEARYGPHWREPNPDYKFWRDSHAIDMEFLND